MTGGPPDELASRHYLIATLEACGFSDIEIGQRLGFHPNRISLIRKAPEYAAVLARERAAVQSQLRTSRVEEIDGLFPDAIAAKRDCLQQRDNLAVTNAASDSILDRVYPRKQAIGEGTGERVTRVVLTIEDERRIEATLREVGAIDVTPPPAVEEIA